MPLTPSNSFAPVRKATFARVRLGRSGLALLGLLSLGGVFGQSQESGAVDVCTVPDALLQVSVGGQTRGDFLVKVAPGALYLEASALQASEAKYGKAPLTCDGLDYVQLDPQVKPAYDPLAQTLSLTPVLDLLPGNTLDFRGVQAVTPSPTQPAYGADAGLRASAATGGTLNAQGYLGGAYFGGPFSAYAGVTASVNSAQTADASRNTVGGFGLRALARYDINPDWAVSASYQADPDTVGGLGYSVSSFSGLSVTARGGLQRELARVELDLPLEANVTVRVGERTLRQFRAAPGRLVLLNIPLENIVGTVEVNVTDTNGTRTFSSPYSFGGGTLQPGAYLLTGRGGYLGSPFSGGALRTLDLNGRLGLSGNWSVQAAARLLESSYAASVQGRHASESDSFGVGASVIGAFGSQVGALSPDLRLNADYARQVGPLGLSATVSLPVFNLGASQFGAGVGYQAGRWAGTLSGSYDLGAQVLGASLGAGYTFDDARQVSASLSGSYNFPLQNWNAGLTANYVPDSSKQFSAYVNGSSGGANTAGRIQAGVGVRFTPDDRLTVDAGANVSRQPSVDPASGLNGEPATALGGSLAASYLLAPGQSLRASTDFKSLNAGYEDTRTLYTAANVVVARTDSGLSGAVSGEVRGAVTVLNGRAVLGQKLGQRAVVVRTGTPGIPLLLNGARVAVTDSAGEALLTGLPEGSISQVAVDLDALPFNITARDATADVSLAQSGVYVLDWTRNFDVSRWVRLFWTPSEFSVYGVFLIGTEKYTLDDQGYVLIPDTGKAQSGTLRSDDGARSCTLDVPATGETAVCPPQPVQNNLGQATGAAPARPATAASELARTDAQIAAQIAAGGPELLLRPPLATSPGAGDDSSTPAPEAQVTDPAASTAQP